MRWAAILAVLLVTLPAVADEESARFFTSRGRKALEAENYAEAEKQFTKALAESQDYLPAVLGLAETAEAAGKRDTAIKHLESCIERGKQSGLSADEREAVGKAKELLKKLDRARLEYRELIDDYAAKLLDLANRAKKKNKELARRCVARVLEVAPEHAEAKALARELGGGPAPVAGSAAKPGETPLFNGRDLTGWSGRPPVWTVVAGVVHAVAGDAAYFMRTMEALKGDYTVEFEARLAEETGGLPMFDISWGFKGTYDVWHLNVFSDKFRLTHYLGTDQDYEKVATVNYYQLKQKFDRSSWNTYRVEVRGNKATISVNGEKLFDHAATEGEYDGPVAVTVQDGTAEFRRVALIE